MRQLIQADLKPLTPVQQQLVTAQTQLTIYRQTLQTKLWWSITVAQL